MGEILVETRDAIRVLTICNEPIRNAFDESMSVALLEAFNTAEADQRIRVVIVTGAGDLAFSSGHDLNELASGEHARSTVGEAPFVRPLTMRKPVIAAVNGHCWAAGFMLALSCDLRVASENAVFGSPGARLGLLPEGGQLYRLPQLIPPARALEMMLTAEPMSAGQAARFELVSRLVPTGQALAEAMTMAAVIASRSPAVVQAVKSGVNLGLRDGTRTAERYEAETALAMHQGPDSREGIAAFLEKRAPRFADLRSLPSSDHSGA
ncbi:short chain enoyl-CoA hydratase [Caballeronia hypogeia]|uniref:Short chain enoyl-CoA hydratase n=1 Tax=Caballeronia hypogeia TaxID=1777140 RepID=A0A158DLJ6_9BURK|nr:enoyl-CoA hydratase/isomerase family protein [Caballeronia hypogeia]SAK95511.1 short chain enoyl-CoA hydratase [Caballeronia hypogeia]